VSEKTLIEAINDGFHVELGRDESVMVMGEDVGRAGGVFRATAGLRDKFGPDRCVDTPLAEAGILGTAMGLCMAGWRPVCEMQYDAFSYPCLDQLITHVGRYRWRTGGGMEFPVTIRMPYGGGVRAPELHDDSPEAYYVHTPGVKVAIPSTPADAKGLLAAAIREPDPVVILEPKLHYRTMRGEVPDGEHVVPLGEARVAREGTDVSLVAYGSMVPLCEQAADALAGEASVEVLDLRTLKPLDEDALLASAAKTGRVVIVQEAPRTAGFGAELAAILAEKAILDLRGPVIRVTGYDVPYPYWQIEDAYMPSVERVVDAARKLLQFGCFTGCRSISGTCTATSRATSSRCSRWSWATRSTSRCPTTRGSWSRTCTSSRPTPRSTRATRSPARLRCAAHSRARRLPSVSTKSVRGAGE
jgi:pyruvate dehydrogenase E1 component beta subunit